MEIKFFCKSCGQKLAVDEQYAGMDAVCPQCNATILVPAVSEEVPESAAEADPDTMKTMRGNLPEDPDRTQVGRRSYGDVAGSGTDDVTMPGKRDRKPDGRFVVGDLIIGRYKVLAELGQGGMGVVYKCFDETAGIEVALKALPPELSHNTLEMEDIKENFQLVHNLHHPNIASYNTLEKDNANGNYYLVMECVNGKDLRRWIRQKRKEGPITLEMILPILRQIADALDYAHKEGIIHRDIKPSNVIIKDDGEIKVLDFGLAAQIHTSMTHVSVAYHDTSGTGPYMAPEQWRGKVQGAAADQYALAVMTYEMLAGHLPFDSQDNAILREAVLNEAADPISVLSKAGNSVLQRGMGKDAEKRFVNCTEFTMALQSGVTVDFSKNIQLSLRIMSKKIESGFHLLSRQVYFLTVKNAHKIATVIRKPQPHQIVLKCFKIFLSFIAALLAILLLGEAIIVIKNTWDKHTRSAAIKETQQKNTQLAKEYLAKEDFLQAAHYARNADRTAPAVQLILGLQKIQSGNSAAGVNEGFQLIQSAANADYPAAQFQLGWLYKEGIGCTQNFQTAFLWIKKAASQGDVSAQKTLGDMYLTGIGTIKSPESAVHWYQAAADQGGAAAQGALGGCYLFGDGVKKNPVEAVKWLRKAAIQGDARGQIGLGLCYKYGDGVTKDPVEAAKWFRKAAEQGDVRGQANLGFCYKYGDGVVKDLVEAVKWFRKAAEQEDVEGQIGLGFCYKYGDGVAKAPVEAVKWFRKAAEQGADIAQWQLGVCYADGDGVVKDPVEAVKWLRKAAEQGFAAAQGDLGICYHFGDGVAKDPVEAVKWYRKAAEGGYAKGQTNLGLCYKHGDGVEKNPVEAAKWFRKAAEQGDAQGQANLGLCYQSGQGVEKNPEEAVKWLRKAAEQGFAAAQNALGRCYHFGDGVEKNPEEAVKWYRRAVEQGNAAAQYSLGVCYCNGEGVEKNMPEAATWWRKAADQGDVSAQYSLGVCYAKGDGVEKNQTDAAKWFRKAAEQGLADAQYGLGLCYENGNGVEKNYIEAVKWYRKAAEQGNAAAQDCLGICYARENDFPEAFKWFRKAAEQGDAHAQCNLGLCYENGNGVEKNYIEAVKWYRRAAEQGDVMAQYSLGVCYYRGDGVEKNPGEAVKWFRKAAEQGNVEAQKVLGDIGNEKVREFMPHGIVMLPNDVELKMIMVVAGRFQDEEQHWVTLTQDYWLGETEVTQEQWQAVMGNNPSVFRKGGKYPVECISWNDAMAFCKKLNQQYPIPGMEFTLPTEAQWVYAAIGGQQSKGYKYSGSNYLNAVGWYGYNHEQSTSPVGTKQPNELGFRDMSGNVEEWCLDVVSGRYRVSHGGSWYGEASDCLPMNRALLSPDYCIHERGFRVALVPEK